MPVRRLAAVVHPIPGESFPSWIDRISRHWGKPPGYVAEDLGLSFGPNGGGRPAYFGDRLTERSRQSAQQATGLSAEVLDSMQLAVFEPSVISFRRLHAWHIEDRIRRNHQWALFYNSRACPACLEEDDGAWQLLWRLSVAAICPRHRLLLASTCPECGLNIRYGRHGKTYNYEFSDEYRSFGGDYRLEDCPNPRPGLSKQRISDPLTCQNYLAAYSRGRSIKTDPCQQRLDELRRIDMPSGLVAAQVSYLRAAFGYPMTIAGYPIRATAWIQVFKTLVALARTAAPFTDLPEALESHSGLHDAHHREALHQEKLRREHGWGNTPWSLPSWRENSERKPTTAAEAAVLLAVVAPILHAADEEALGDRIRPLWTAVRARTNHSRPQFLEPPFDKGIWDFINRHILRSAKRTRKRLRLCLTNPAPEQLALPSQIHLRLADYLPDPFQDPPPLAA